MFTLNYRLEIRKPLFLHILEPDNGFSTRSSFSLYYLHMAANI